MLLFLTNYLKILTDCLEQNNCVQMFILSCLYLLLQLGISVLMKNETTSFGKYSLQRVTIISIILVCQMLSSNTFVGTLSKNINELMCK